MSTSGRSSFSCIQITLSCVFSGSLAAAADGASLGSGLSTRYFAIFLSILIWAMSKFPVIAFFQRIEEIRRGVQFAVVFDLLIAPRLDLRAVLQSEHIGGVLQVVLLHQNALKGLRIESESRTALESLLEGVHVDVLEILVLVIGRHVRRLGDRGIHPKLCRRLNVHVLL